MDLEQLSKSQLVLLTLLVSFVTSMATGIVAVALMDQAPIQIAQTVDRVIERTVEKVVPSEAQPAAASAATVVTTEKTVVVKETDLVAQAVAKASPSVIRLFAGESNEATFLGLGIVVNAQGLIAVDARPLGERAEGYIQLADGSRVRAFVVSRNEVASVAFLEPAATGTTPAPRWVPAQLAVGQPTLGASAVVLSGRTSTRIASALVSSFAPKSDTVPLQLVETDLGAESIMPGSPLIDTNGAVIGLSTGSARAAHASAFVPAVALMPPMPEAK
ncbi:trypsin-like peptidase domain-containing protein [Candidatus Kaiserbacteria bacterium]|nr:trypsin-like peptidase domain-containing protein [Candidatus Kaiserbacteria bacterium]